MAREQGGDGGEQQLGVLAAGEGRQAERNEFLTLRLQQRHASLSSGGVNTEDQHRKKLLAGEFADDLGDQ